MKKSFYSVRAGCSLVVLCAWAGSSYSQCATPPTSGTTTISTSGTIINSYYPGTGSPTAGSSSITLGTLDSRGSSTTIGTGDQIVLMQMQGSDINTANTVAYGGGNSSAPANGYTNNANLVAGNYEYATVTSVSGSTVNLSVGLSHNYYTRAFTQTASIQAFQVIRVPLYYNLIVSLGASITAPEWNGATGGAVMIDVANVFTLNGSVNVASMGFRGGGGIDLDGAQTGNSSTNTSGQTALQNTDYRFNSPVYNSANQAGGAKGEGIAGTPAYIFTYNATLTVTESVEGYINGSMGRGAPGNAGGGGTDGIPVGTGDNQYNTGGGGGSNAGSGGQGGSGWPNGTGSDDSAAYPYGGYGGASFAQGNLQKIIMGGGGGAGTANNSTTANQANTSGGPGGGIIVSLAASYAGSGSFIADGGKGPGVTQTYSPAQTDAAGGGGGGGTIVAVTTATGTTGLASITASAVGGPGDSVTTYFNHGPGGGGGGGYIYSNGSFSSTAVNGGTNGLTRSTSPTGPINNSYNSRPGSSGQVTKLSGPPIFTCGVLPVVLETFTASPVRSAVLLNWQTGASMNFSHFEVEHSTDGTHFEPIGQVDYFNNQTGYNFTDFSPGNARVYYRLSMISDDGATSFSNILSVNLGSGVPAVPLVLYPNPATSQVSAQFSAMASQQVQARIYDNTGRQLASLVLPAQAGNNYVLLADVSEYAPGAYLVAIGVDAKTLVQKFVVLKR